MNSPAPLHLAPERIYWWARQHALILLIGVTAAWLERSGLLLAAMAGASFLAIFRMPQPTSPASPGRLWQKALLFGRIVIALGVIMEPQMDSSAIAATLATLTVFQLLEAWLSRQHISPHLALIEQETDAIWVISLCFLLVPLTPWGHGMIWLALLRPLAVMTSHWSGAPRCPMPWNFSARLLSGISLLALAAPLLAIIPRGIAQVVVVAGIVGWIALLAIWAVRALRVSGKTL